MDKKPKNLQILGVDFSEPFDIKTFSGSSYYIWNELKKQNVLCDAFTPHPSSAMTYWYKLRSFHPYRQKWKSNWHASVPFRSLLSTRASGIIKTKYLNRIDATLQVGAYYDFSNVWPGIKGLIADNNCAIAQQTNINYTATSASYQRLFDFEKRVYHSMDCIFAFSRFLADSFIHDFGCPPEKVHVIYAGINLDETKLQHDSPQKGDKIVIFSAFDFVNKGGEILLKAFEIVRKKVPDAKLIIMGSEISGPPEYVTCLGPLSKTNPDHLEILYRYFNEATVLAHPTLADAFPNVIREAMAAGLPCIASDIGAIPEMVDNNKTGFLIPKGDSQALAEKLIYLLTHEDICRAMGKAAYERQKKDFTWTAVCNKIVSKLCACK